jgi:hypothetical protein
MMHPRAKESGKNWKGVPKTTWDEVESPSDVRFSRCMELEYKKFAREAISLKLNNSETVKDTNIFVFGLIVKLSKINHMHSVIGSEPKHVDVQ